MTSAKIIEQEPETDAELDAELDEAELDAEETDTPPMS